jgi:hypothetical protein
VVADPIVDQADEPDNPAHAKVVSEPRPGSKALRRLREALADMSVVVSFPATSR